MEEDWKDYKLGDLGTFTGGVTSIKPDDYGHGTPFIPYKNIYKYSKVNVHELELMNVTQKDIEKRNCIYGDILFTASSETPDEVAMSSVLLNAIPNLTFNGFSKRYRLNDFNTLSPEFARYLFRNKIFRQEVYQLATGDIRFNISQESLAKIKIKIPSLTTQNKIASILSSHDDKIELNLQMNKTLESIAQAIFKEYFVDFRFPGFDGELEDGLPKGWRKCTLSEVVNVKGGSTPSTSNPEYWDGENFWATPKDLSSLQSPVLLTTERRITDSGVKQISSGVLPKGTLLLSSRAPIGYIAINQIPVSINQGFIAIHGKLVSNLFMLFWLKRNMDLIKGRANGSTFLEISKSSFKGIGISIPNSELLNSFDQIINPIFERIISNEKENRTLIKIRDILIPKLMTCKIRVA